MTPGSAPLLLLDVDGPLNPWKADPSRRPKGYTAHRMRPLGWDRPGQRPLRVWLNASHGPALLALPYELVWATTWRADANEWIAPALGLPRLPFVDWPAASTPGERLRRKRGAIVRYAAGRPFAWVDDETADDDRRWVDRHHPAPALLHRVDPRIGLTAADFEELAAWAAGPARGDG